MQFKNIFTFALFGAALATPVVERRQGKGPADIVVAQLNSVQKAVTTLNTAVVGLTPGSSVADILAKSKAVETAIIAAEKAISALENGKITLMQALPISSVSTSLGNLTKDVIKNLIAKKSVIVQAKQLETTQKQLAAQKTAAVALGKAIVAKLPATVATIAAKLSSEISDALEKGAQEFSKP